MLLFIYIVYLSSVCCPLSELERYTSIIIDTHRDELLYNDYKENILLESTQDFK